MSAQYHTQQQDILPTNSYKRFNFLVTNRPFQFKVGLELERFLHRKQKTGITWTHFQMLQVQQAEHNNRKMLWVSKSLNWPTQ